MHCWNNILLILRQFLQWRFCLISTGNPTKRSGWVLAFYFRRLYLSNNYQHTTHLWFWYLTYNIELSEGAETIIRTFNVWLSNKPNYIICSQSQWPSSYSSYNCSNHGYLVVISYIAHCVCAAILSPSLVVLTRCWLLFLNQVFSFHAKNVFKKCHDLFPNILRKNNCRHFFCRKSR